MKKLFTLMAVAACAASTQAQDVYNTIVDGKLATEFAAVAGESGGVANNSVDGKSIITMTAGAATVTAVGGTTPADATEGGQQITLGESIDEVNHIYKIKSVDAWNDISWSVKNQGDIDFWYVLGTGNPYVDMNAVENSRDGVWQGTYKADYIYYEPDGSKGMPVTGLYYKFTATAQGAFKVKVFANKGNRKTFVVNANTMKAERLFASGYINGVNDDAGKKKLLTVEQVDSVHHVYIYGSYDALVKANEEAIAAGQEAPNSEEKLATAKAEADAMANEREFVIGNGNQNFWGWLTFDVEPGEEYWVFQHSGQIGFGGFEFHEGMTAEELIEGIEPPYVYTTNFSTYEEEETGERVTWKGEKAVGDGDFTSTDEEGAAFGEYFQNAMTDDWRTSYCVLPEDVLAHSANTEALSFGVWVKAPEDIESEAYAGVPMLAAYDEYKDINEAPFFVLQYNGTAKLDNGTQCDYTDEQNVAGANVIYSGENDWLADKKWHYYTAVFEGENAKIYFDGELKNEWNCDGAQAGFFSNGAALKYVCLGGNQIDEAEDGNDAPFAFARLLIKNSTMTPGEIIAQMNSDFAGWKDQNESSETIKGDVNNDGSVDVADISSIISVMAGGTATGNADVNNDGSVDVADISAVISIMAGAE